MMLLPLGRAAARLSSPPVPPARVASRADDVFLCLEELPMDDMQRLPSGSSNLAIEVYGMIGSGKSSLLFYSLWDDRLSVSCSKKGCHLCQVNQLGKVTLDHRLVKYSCVISCTPLVILPMELALALEKMVNEKLPNLPTARGVLRGNGLSGAFLQ
ncbi:hypothetical protein VPH35_078118 [Triticum aestivum]|uniref:Uncharacterized protein n=1 Tax=Aegilops tauschii TaxID=37682 RepID=M8BN69_AEGTA